MRITGLKIDGFGVWSGLELADLPDQLTVLYGPNEAGKTTLMQFVRSMLYGFAPLRRARYLPPVRVGRPGGTLMAVSGQRSYIISRHADEQGAQGETALVDDGAETTRDPLVLARLVGEVDEPTFNNVFAFGLREIQELGTLSDTQAADELYELALGLDRVSLLDVMRDLETTRHRLLAPDDRPSLVTQLIGQRERLRGEIEELGQGTARYLTLESERDKLDSEIARLDLEVARFEQQSRELALARALGDRWRRRTAIDERLARVVGFESLPDDALARFDRLSARITARRSRFAKLNKRRRELLQQIERLAINEPLCRAALRLEALGEQQQWMSSLETEVGELEAELLELESKRQENLTRFGLAEIAGAKSAAVGSPRGWSQLRASAVGLRAARVDLSKLKQTIAAADETAATHERQLAGMLDKAQPGGLTRALADAGEHVSQLRKRVQLDERLDQMSRREAELEEQSQEHLESQILPTWVIFGVGAMFVTGCALVLLYLAGLVLPISFHRALGWPVGLIGVLAAVAGSFTKVIMERSASRRLEGCQGQLQLLGQQIQQAKDERDALDSRLPRGGGPLVSRLQTAEKALARLEQLLPQEAQRETADHQASALRGQAEAKGIEYRGLKKRWRQLLVENGLPADLKPAQLRQFARYRNELQGMDTQIERVRDDLSRRKAEHHALSGRITQLLAEIGFKPRATRPLDQLRECLAEWSQQQSRLAERDALQGRIIRFRRRQKSIKREAQTLRRRQLALLEMAGTTDAAEFRRLALAQAEAAQLSAERAQIAHEIAATIAGQVGEDQLAAWLAAPHDLEQIELHVADARRIAAGHVSQARERRGEMNQQLKTLLDDRRVTHKRIELGCVEKRLHDALARWRVVTVCGMMLEAVRAYYEREHQPPALREASGYLKRLTGGRYTRVWTPLGEHALVVDDQHGQSLRVELLSRGTREQLFLALRLALVGSYARRSVRLPLVLDDVFVNFDAPRAKAAALVLRDFARAGHQLLIFTCHEHIARLFKHLKAEVRQLPDNAHADQLAAEYTPRKSRRGRTEPLEEPSVEPLPDEEPVYADTYDEVEPELPAPPVAPPEPEPTPRPEPQPARRAEPRPAPRIERRVERVQWSAEEFDGELADRVRRPARSTRESAGQSDVVDEDDDAEAA